MIEIYQNHVDQWEFEIKAKNNRTLAFSMNGYESKRSCLNAIRSLLENVGVRNVADRMDGIKERKRRKYV